MVRALTMEGRGSRKIDYGLARGPRELFFPFQRRRWTKQKICQRVEMSSGGGRVGWLGWAVSLLKGEPFFTLSELMIIVHR